MNERTEYKCLECGVFLEYDIRGGDSGEYVCPKCGARYDRVEYFEMLEGRREKKKQPKPNEEEPMASKRGKCVKCGEERSLVAKGLCGTCYTLSRKGGKAKKAKKEPKAIAPLSPAASPGQGPAAPNVIAPPKRFGISFDIEIIISNARIGE